MQTMPVAFILGAGKMTQVNAMYYPAAGQPPIPVFESLPARDAKLKANEKILASIPAKVPLPDETPVVKRKWRSKLRAMDKPETVKPPSPVKMPRRKPIYPKPAYEELPGGAVRVRETTMEASQFRQLVDINGREWLVYVRFSLQVEPGVYAYDLFFAGRFRSGVRARFVGKIDEPLPGGHMPFKHLDSLHGLQLDRDAWWAINKTRIPMISKTPGANETPFVPHHVVRNEYGQETHEPDAFHRHDFVTYIADGTHIQAFVLARHDPILPSAQRLYVIACLRVREYVVHTVYGKDLRPPEIQCLVRPGPADCWWVKSYDACMQSEPLKYHLGCCPAPRDGFKRGHVVSIPDPLVEGNRLCACVARTWITEGRLMYQVQYPTNSGSLYTGYQTVFKTADLLGPSVKWCVSDFSFDLASTAEEMLLSTLPRQPVEREESPEPLSPLTELGLPELVPREEGMEDLDLGLPELEDGGPCKVRRVTIERPPLVLQTVEATGWNWVEGSKPEPKQEEPAPSTPSEFDVDQFFN